MNIEEATKPCSRASVLLSFLGLSLSLVLGSSCTVEAEDKYDYDYTPQSDSLPNREDSRQRPQGSVPSRDRPPIDGVGQELCTNTCDYAFNNECDDGGTGSSYDDCAIGSDCGDCGPRNADAGQVECPGEWFDDGQFCDKDCFPNDPDCDLPAEEECPQSWLDDGQFCDKDCFPNDPDCDLPVEEECPQSWFGDGQFCDKDCFPNDPDCADDAGNPDGAGNPDNPDPGGTEPQQCAACGNGETCNPVNGQCECDLFSRFTYTFDGNSIDWSIVSSVNITINHTRSDVSPPEDREAYDQRAISHYSEEKIVTKSFAASCEANAQLRLNYTLNGGVKCERNMSVVGGDGHVVLPNESCN